MKDAKFIDDQHIMLLTTDTSGAQLLKHPYRAGAGNTSAMNFVPWNATDRATQHEFNAILPIELLKEDGSSSYTCHTYSIGAMQPIRLEINGRKGRRVVCVLGEDLQQYQVLDLDSGAVALDETGSESNVGGDGDLEMY